MTTQYLNRRTNTTITVEIVRDDKLNHYLADNKHLDSPNLGTQPPSVRAVSRLSESALVSDSFEGDVFDGLLYDLLRYEHYESVAQILDDEELEQGEIEDIYLGSFIKPDIRGLVRERTIGDKKLNGWFRGNTHRRNAKRNRKDVAISKFLNDVRRRPSQRRELAAALI